MGFVADDARPTGRPVLGGMPEGQAQEGECHARQFPFQRMDAGARVGAHEGVEDELKIIEHKFLRVINKN